MEISGFWRIVVKVEVDVEDSKGNIKTKKTKEVYLVEDCGDPQDAVKIVEKEMSGCMYPWAIESIKEDKITAVIHKS